MFILQWLAISVWNIISLLIGLAVLAVLVLVGLFFYFKYKGKTFTFTVGKKKDDYETVDENKP